MISEATIMMNYTRAKQQADRLNEIASKVERLSTENMQRTLQGVSSDWKGDNASAFLNKGNKLQGDLRATAGEIRNAATALRTSAKRIYDAEMAALAIAQARNYK